MGNTENKHSRYQLLVFIAYGFYILFGLAWFITSMAGKHTLFNYQALLIIIIFGLQAYFRNKFANLIIGIGTLFLSIFMLLDIVDQFATGPKGLFAILASIALISIVLSGILIFSYKKFND